MTFFFFLILSPPGKWWLPQPPYSEGVKTQALDRQRALFRQRIAVLGLVPHLLAAENTIVKWTQLYRAQTLSAHPCLDTSLRALESCCVRLRQYCAITAPCLCHHYLLLHLCLYFLVSQLATCISYLSQGEEEK